MAGNHRRVLIAQKLKNLQQCIAELEPYLKGSAERFEGDPARRRIVERLVQVIVESGIDTNALIIESNGWSAPSSARESFQVLLEHHVLDESVAKRYIEKYVGLRNVIVHLYEKVEPKTLFYSSKRLLKDSEEYARQIQRYLAAGSRNRIRS